MDILHTPGVQSVTVASGTPFSDLTLNGIVSILDVEGEPDAVVVNPADWSKMLQLKATSSGTRLDWSARSAAPRPCSSAKASNVRISDSDQDDSTRNVVTMLAEGRFGVAILQPSCFCTVALT